MSITGNSNNIFVNDANLKIAGANKGLLFSDGSIMYTAPLGSDNSNTFYFGNAINAFIITESSANVGFAGNTAPGHSLSIANDFYVDINGNLVTNGNITATSMFDATVGNVGLAISNLQASNALVWLSSSNASNITQGTLNNTRLPSTISVSTLEAGGVNLGTAISNLQTANATTWTNLSDNSSRIGLYESNIHLGGFNVGISPSIFTPTANLHVVGNAYITSNITASGIFFNDLGSTDWAKLYTEGTEDDGDNNLEHKLVLELGDDSVPADFVIRRYNDSTELFKFESETGDLDISGSVWASGTFSGTTFTATTKVETNLIEARTGSTTITMGDTVVFNDGFRPNGSTYNIIWNGTTNRIETPDPWTIGGAFFNPPIGSTVVPITAKPANSTDIMRLYESGGTDVFQVAETEVRAYKPLVINNGNYVDWYNGLGQQVKRDFGNVDYLVNNDRIIQLQGNDYTINGENGGDIKIGGLTGYLFYDYSTQLIGIGTTSPINPLHIKTSDLDVLRLESTSTVRSSIIFAPSGTHWEVGARGSTGNPNNAFYFYGNSDYRLVIRDNGNVGIGTYTPTTILTVEKDSVATSGDPSQNGWGQLCLSSTTHPDNFTNKGQLKLGFDHSVAPYGVGVIQCVIPYQYAPPLSLCPKGGNVGIGTTSPTNKLHVSGSVESAILKEDSTASTNNFNYIINGPRPGTSSGGAVMYINGSTRSVDGGVSALTFRNDSGNINLGHDSYSTNLYGAQIYYIGSSPKRINIGTSYDGTFYGSLQHAGSAGESMTSWIRAGHHVIVAGYRSGTNDWGLFTGNTGGPGVYLTGGATSWSSTSDERKKIIHEEISNVLPKIDKYRCVYYNLLNDNLEETINQMGAVVPPMKKRIGFVAQDFMDDFPDVVDGTDDTEYSMRYTETIPILLQAIKELKARIEALENNNP